MQVRAAAVQRGQSGDRRTRINAPRPAGWQAGRRDLPTNTGNIGEARMSVPKHNGDNIAQKYQDPGHSEHNRRKADQSRLHQLAVSPTVNVMTIITVILAVFGGGTAIGMMQSDSRNQQRDIAELREAAKENLNKATSAEAMAAENRQLMKRVEDSINEVQADIKTILREMRRN